MTARRLHWGGNGAKVTSFLIKIPSLFDGAHDGGRRGDSSIRLALDCSVDVGGYYRSTPCGQAPRGEILAPGITPSRGQLGGSGCYLYSLLSRGASRGRPHAVKRGHHHVRPSHVSRKYLPRSSQPQSKRRPPVPVPLVLTPASRPRRWLAAPRHASAPIADAELGCATSGRQTGQRARSNA